jgi:hypothetical protein
MSLPGYLYLVLVGMLIYASPLWSYFHSVDIVWLRALQKQNLTELLWSEFSVGSPEDYQPLKSLYLYLLHKALGDWPEGFHAANMLLHIGGAVLLYLLAVRLQLRAPAAWLAAFFFLVHPAPHKAVQWITDCSGLLRTVFTLGALLGSFAYFERGKTRHLVLALLAGAAALYTKESGIVALVLIPLADWLLRPSLPLRRLWIYWPIPVLLLLFLPLSLRQMPGWREHLEGYRLGVHLPENIAYSLGFLLSLPKSFNGFFSWSSWLGVLLLLVAVYAPLERRIGVLLAAWLLLAVLPSALFVQQGSYETTGRYSHGWLAPAALALAFLVQRLIGSGEARASVWIKRCVLAGATLALVALGITTSRLAAEPYETHPGPILYHYVVLSLLSDDRADRYLIAELGCPTARLLEDAVVWAEKIAEGSKEPLRVIQGELVAGLSRTIAGQPQGARLRFDRALQVLAARGSVPLVRGASVQLKRARQLTEHWLQFPPVAVCDERRVR